MLPGLTDAVLPHRLGKVFKTRSDSHSMGRRNLILLAYVASFISANAVLALLYASGSIGLTIWIIALCMVSSLWPLFLLSSEERCEGLADGRPPE